MPLETLRGMRREVCTINWAAGFTATRWTNDGSCRTSKNALRSGSLVGLLPEAYQLTHDEFYASVARSTLDYVLRDMTHSEGGFYSAKTPTASSIPQSQGKRRGCVLFVDRSRVGTTFGTSARLNYSLSFRRRAGRQRP